LRLQYQRTGTAAARLPSEILRLLLETFQAAGLQPALGLEKRPRPMLHLGHPLPQGTEGLQEYVEVVLQGPTIDPDPVPGLNAVAPEGLTFMSCEVLPDYATPVLDLCQRAEWRWRCPETLRTGAAERIRAFLAADSFQIEKTGKEGGQKQVKKVEVRPLVLAMQWDGDALRFETRLEPGQALHPAKLLGGILGVEPARITGLVRTRIDLAEDPRLDQAERFEPKLKNMFEDAVLLKAGPNLRLIDEDEDEPLQLG
jgi:radical SAM-linked protein